jgi:BON domain-containing protein
MARGDYGYSRYGRRRDFDRDYETYRDTYERGYGGGYYREPYGRGHRRGEYYDQGYGRHSNIVEGGRGGYRPGYGSSTYGGAGYDEWGAGTGQYAGRGPRNYQRSDERIEEDINEWLTDHGDLDATDIEVKVNNGEVTLSGSVDSRWAKRIAEDVAESVSGVKDVNNNLRVTQNWQGQQGQEQSRQGRPEQQGRR